MKPQVAVTATSFCASSPLVDEAKKRSHQADFKFCSPKQRWEPESLADFVFGSIAWIVGKEPVTEELLSQLPGLRLISKYGVGTDNIDFDACQKHGVKVYYESGVNSQEAAELTIGLMISACRNICKGHWNIKQGRWLKDGGQNFSGKKVGIIGFGHIGSKVAALCKSFGCQVLVNDIIDFSDQCTSLGYKWKSFAEILAEAEILSLHVPLTEKTRALLGGNYLELLSPNAIVVNTSRGDVIDQKSLTQMLAVNRIKGLALDVYEDEPLTDKKLYLQENFIGTAHIAGNSIEAVWKMGQAALRGIDKILLEQ